VAAAENLYTLSGDKFGSLNTLDPFNALVDLGTNIPIALAVTEGLRIVHNGD